MPELFLKNLFNKNNRELNIYAVVDASQIKELTNELTTIEDARYQVLLDGDEFTEVAPYLIELKEDDEFTEWIAKNAYDKFGATFSQI